MASLDHSLNISFENITKYLDFYSSSTVHGNYSPTISDSPKQSAILVKDFDFMNTEILEKIGENKSNIVYKALNKITSETSVVKFMKINDKESKKEFFTLYQQLLENNSQSFALKQMGIFKDRTFSHTYALEMEEGVCTLADLITKKKELNQTFEISQIIHIFKEIVEGLAYLHSKGIVHSDIKPSNILLFKKNENDFVFKLIDFDMSRMLQKHDETIRKDQIFGYTKFYASPELFDLDSEKFNPFKSDIFSLGKTFMNIMEITKTYSKRKSIENLKNIDKDEKIYSDLMNLIKKMTTNNPDERIDCYDVKFTLKQLFSKEPEVSDIVKEILLDKEKKISYDENLRLFEVYLKKFANFELAKKYLDRAFAKINVQNQKFSNLELAKFYKNFGFLCKIQGNYNQAEENYLKSLKLIEEREEENHNHQSMMIELFDSLGDLYKKIGEYKKSEDFFLKQYEKTLKLSRDREIYLSKAHINLSSLYYCLGKLYTAEGYILIAYKILTEMKFFRQNTLKIANESPVERYKKHFEYKENLAICYQTMGYIYLELSNYSIAEEFLKKSLEIMTQIYTPKHYLICDVKDALSLLYLKKNNSQNFFYYFLDSKRIKKELFGKNHLDYSFSLDIKSQFYKQNGNKIEKIEEILLKSIQIKEKALGEDNRFALQVYEKLAHLYDNLEENIKAMNLQEKILEKRKKIFGLLDRDTAQSFHNIGVFIFKKEKNYTKSCELLEKSLEIKEKLFSPDDLANKMIIGTLEFLSSIYAKEKLFEKAENTLNVVLNYREELSLNGTFYLQEIIDCLKNMLCFNEKITNKNKYQQLLQKKTEYEKILKRMNDNLTTLMQGKTFLKERMDQRDLHNQNFKKERI